MGFKFDVGLSCFTMGDVRVIPVGNKVALIEELSLGSSAADRVLWVTMELLGVAVEVEVAAALLVTPEKSPIVVNVAEDTGILLEFVADLFFVLLGTVVPSVDLRDALLGHLLTSEVFVTFFLALATVGSAWLTLEGFMAAALGSMGLCSVDWLFSVIELFLLLITLTSPPSVLLLFNCSLTSRKMKIIP